MTFCRQASALCRLALEPDKALPCGSRPTFETSDITKAGTSPAFVMSIKNSPGCLGFAPRSNSFAIEPSVQACSIFSLSGLAAGLRRPSANPLDSSPRALRAGWFSNTKLNKQNKNRQKPAFVLQ